MITGYFGLPRSGKTTALARYIQLKSHKYSHIFVSGERIDPECFDDHSFITQIHPYEIGSFRPPKGSLFVVCEAGTYFNNRSFANIPSYCTDFFALHGHYSGSEELTNTDYWHKCYTTGDDPVVVSGDCDLIWDSQSVDVDKKLRDRTNNLWIVKKSFIRRFSHLTYVAHSIGVNPETQDIQEVYTVPDTLLKKITWLVSFRSIWIYRPLYYGIFDTHSDILFSSDGLRSREIVFSQAKQKYFTQFKLYQSIEDKLNESKK